MIKGKENWFELAETSSYRGSTVDSWVLGMGAITNLIDVIKQIEKALDNIHTIIQYLINP